jgi:VWFA-related protein
MRAALSISLAFLFSAAPAFFAQQVGSNVRTDETTVPTLSMNTQLVIETVEVKDKKGNFVGGLTAKDFNITEDGTPQTVKIFELQHLSTTATPIPPLGKDEENITVYNKLTRTQLAPEPKENSHYKDHRLLALYFDMTTMMPQDQARALGAAMKFVRTQMTAADLVCIMRFNGGAIDILQDFTADRNRLLSILETMVVGEGQGNNNSIDDASSVDTGAAFGQDDSEFNIFNTDRQLSALQTAAHMLAQMSEKKSLIYFASGLRLNGVDNIAQLHATVDEAIRAGVSFWPVDARGLVASAPLGDATEGNAGNANMYNGAGMQASNDRFQQSQDTLFSLAGDTGGKALLDNNDLTRGIVQAQQAISDYYIVGYYTTNSAQNGHFRKVKITANTPTEASLNYRQGYYAGKEFGKFNVADKERQLEDALMLGDPITDLTISMEIDYFQLNRAEYYVPFVVKIPGRELALAKRFGAEHTLIDFVCEIKDEVSGFTVSNVRDYVNIKLTDATAAELAHRPIEYDSGFTLLPGRYSIKFLARDDETGRIGTYQTSFVIPNLNKEAERVPLSSVVIGGERKDLKDVLYDALKAKDRAKDEAANPLVFDGKKLIPSVTRVFHKGRPIYVFAQTYTGAATSNTTAGSTAPTPATPPMLAYLTLSRDGKKQLETVPVAATPATGNRLGMIPFHLTLNADALEPGEYRCQFTVLDPTNGRASFQTFSIELVP